MFFITHKVGYHIKKEKKLVDSLTSLPTYAIPYQIFLGSPKVNKMVISEKELEETRAFIESKNASIYVHSQYIINLCNDDQKVVDLLIKNLEYASKGGFKGVVVHTGKYTDRDKKEAIQIMRNNILKVLESGYDCPLLLETPSGQGTETLTDLEEFVDFVNEFKQLRICIDTCHVFASGYDPLEYIKNVDPKRISLIHLNDSKGKCGSCVDRHEYIGDGHIGLSKLKAIAEYCKDIDKVYEG